MVETQEKSKLKASLIALFREGLNEKYKGVLAKFYGISRNFYINSSVILHNYSTNNRWDIREGCLEGIGGDMVNGGAFFLGGVQLDIINYVVKMFDYKNVPDAHSEEFGKGIQRIMTELNLPVVYDGYKAKRKGGVSIRTIKVHTFTITNTTNVVIDKVSSMRQQRRLQVLFVAHIIRYCTLLPQLFTILNMFEYRESKGWGWYQAWALGHYLPAKGIGIKDIPMITQSYGLFYGNINKLELDPSKVQLAFRRSGSINSAIHSYIKKVEPVKGIITIFSKHPFYTRNSIPVSVLRATWGLTSLIHLYKGAVSYTKDTRGYALINSDSMGVRDSATNYNIVSKFKSIPVISKKIRGVENTIKLVEDPLKDLENNHRVITFGENKGVFLAWNLNGNYLEAIYMFSSTKRSIISYISRLTNRYCYYSSSITPPNSVFSSKITNILGFKTTRDTHTSLTKGNKDTFIVSLPIYFIIDTLNKHEKK